MSGVPWEKWVFEPCSPMQMCRCCVGMGSLFHAPCAQGSVCLSCVCGVCGVTYLCGDLIWAAEDLGAVIAQ